MNSKLFIIKKPLITEKSTALEPSGKYVFDVLPNATKDEIKKAIKELYKVDAVRVNVLNTSEKRKRFRNIVGYKSGFKKAVVTLKEGQKINIAQ